MCQEMFEQLIHWIRNAPARNVVAFYLTSNEATVYPGNLVSFAEGYLTDYSTGSDEERGFQYQWEKITGSGSQSFNDRGHFNRSQRDAIELSLSRSAPPSGSELTVSFSPASIHLAVELTLVTWGRGVISLTDFHCVEGVLFASAEGSPDRNGSNRVGYTITFKPIEVPAG